MRVTLLAATTLATIFATAATASGYPPRKPGLWEVTAQNPKMPAVTTKMCLDAETDILLHMFDIVPTLNCAKHDVKFAGETVTTDTTCLAARTTITTNSVTKFAGDAAYHVDITMHFNPPRAGLSQVSMIQDGKWVGDCPAGMAPGDLILAGTRKINIKTSNNPPSLLPNFGAD